MNTVLQTISRLAGYGGAILCLIAGLSRISGQHYLAGYQSTTLFTAGMAVMVFAVFLKLELSSDD